MKFLVIAERIGNSLIFSTQLIKAFEKNRSRYNFIKIKILISDGDKQDRYRLDYFPDLLSFFFFFSAREKKIAFEKSNFG